MATAVGRIGGVSGYGSGCGSSVGLRKKRRSEKDGLRVSCVYSSSSSSVGDPYRTLKIRHGASESEVKKAFRQLALQYHPDVCRGSNCNMQFHQINEAYGVVMSHLRGGTSMPLREMGEQYDDGGVEETNEEQEWDLWEEWMGWEGAGTRDYSSHVNPYL